MVEATPPWGGDESLQEPTRIILVRHGETAWNAEMRMQGQLDVPLNEVGRWQAARVAAALAEESLAAIYSSDLARASQTAAPLSQVTGLPIIPEAGLRERCFGIFQGSTFTEVETRWPEQSRRWRRRDPDFAPEGAESLVAFSARCVGAARRIAAAHPGESIALVSHGGVLDCLYRAATGIELQASRSWRLANASINRLLYTPQGFTLVGWSDVSHLEAVTLDETDEGESPLPPPDRMGYAA